MFVSTSQYHYCRQFQNYSKLSHQHAHLSHHPAYPSHYAIVIKKLVLQIKSILLMQGRTEPNCLHQLFAIKLTSTADLDKLCNFIVEKRYCQILIEVITLYQQGRNPINSHMCSLKVYNKLFISIETISKVFENDYDLANKYEKDKHYATIRVIKNPYFFNFNDDHQCLPFKCPIDEAFNKPPEFTYKTTLEKIEREKKNVENLIAFTRRQNRKAMGLYLDSMKEQQRPRKKVKQNQDEDETPVKKIQSESHKSKQFDFIGFL